MSIGNKTCGDGNADNCPGCWQCFDEEQEFFTAVEAGHRADTVKILIRRGMDRTEAHAKTQQLDLDEHGDKTAAQLATMIAGDEQNEQAWADGPYGRVS